MKSNQNKAAFRRTSKWKNFRKYMKKISKIDYITGKPLLKGWQLHHLDMSEEHYTNLDQRNFKCLNRMSHEFIHWLFRYTDWRDVLTRTAIVLEEMERLNYQKTDKNKKI